MCTFYIIEVYYVKLNINYIIEVFFLIIVLFLINKFLNYIIEAK